MKTFLKLTLCLSLLWSCSQKPADEATSEEKTITDSNQLEEVAEVETKNVGDKDQRRIYKTTLNGKTVFYVREKEKWGLEYEDSGELLAMEFDKIYSPNITAREYVEIEQDGKLGLFDYVRGIVVAPKYDLIYPADGTKYIAIGKIGKQFFGILSETKTEKLSAETSPTYANLEAETIFDLKKSKAIPVFVTEDEYEEYMSNGIVFLPSFVNNLGLMENGLFEAVSFDESGLGITQADMKIIRAETISEKLKILFTSFYIEVIGARGYTIESTKATIIDESNKVVDSKQLAETYGSEQAVMAFCGDNLLEYFMLSERLLEVEDVKATQGNYPSYASMTQFSYYKITDDGKLQKLESNRFYDCTKFASMNSSHFEGCFYVFSNGDDNMENGNIWASDHLSIEDLDIMRNEIFAEYGYKFKSEKWQKYFAGKVWYFPKHDNVDKFLTDLEKENIKTILKLKERMEKAGEQKFTNRRSETLMMAG